MKNSKTNSLPTDQAPGSNSRPKSTARFWWSAIIAVVALKLFLVAHDGIIPCKFDARNYAQASGHLFSSDDLSRMPTHRPGLPIIAAVVAQLGIPYKLYLEFLLCFNAAVAGMMVSQLMRSFWPGVAVFGVIVFNPWFMANSQLFMTEPLVAVLMLMQLVFGVQMIVRPIHEWTVWHAVFAGSATLLHVLSRNETALVFLYWIAVAIVVLVRQRKTIFSTSFVKRKGNAKICLLVLPVAMTLGTTAIVKTYNHQKFGVAAQCTTEGEGFVSLMEALYSIPPAEKIRYAPVTQQSMQLACEHSPTLAKYRERLMDSNLAAYRIAKTKLGFDNEFGTWLNWHLFNCFRGSLQEVDQEMKQAADEIRLAQSEGKLERRAAKYPISPYTDLWIGDVWGNFVLTVKYSLFVQKSDLSGYYVDNKSTDAFDVSLFDESLLRRNGLANNPRIAISGTLASGTSVATEAVVCDKDGNVIASAKIESVPNGQGASFNCVLDAMEYEDTNEPLFVYLKRDSESEAWRTGQTQLYLRRYQFVQLQFESSAGNQATDTPVEQWNLQGHRMSVGDGSAREKAKEKITDNYLWLLIGCWGIAFVAGLASSCTRLQFFDVVWVGIAAIVFVFVRCLMYSLIHAWLMWGLYRYVEPNNFMFIVGIACMSFVLGGCVRGAVFRGTSARSVSPEPTS